MAAPTPAKRRKLDHIANTLKKPFVSPLRASKPQKVHQEHADRPTIAPQPYLPSTLAHTLKPPCTPIRLSQSHGSVEDPCNSAPQRTKPSRKPYSLSQQSSKTSTPAIHTAQKAVSVLESQIKKAQNDLETLNQAQKLSTSSTDAELETLTEKWRIAAQAAAEELFGQVKERVQGMGGVAAWRQMERRKYERQNGTGEFEQLAEASDYDDCEFDSEGEELPEKEQEYRKQMKRKAKQEMLDAADISAHPDVDPALAKNQVWQDGGEDDDSFTMDMMLRTLNIDLKMIGYDKQMQRWV